MNERLWTVPKKSVYKTLGNVKVQQRELIQVDKRSSQPELSKAYTKVSYLLGIIDNLRGLGLLDNEIYQSLIEENVRLEEKIGLLIKEKKSTQPTANRVERTSK